MHLPGGVGQSAHITGDVRKAKILPCSFETYFTARLRITRGHSVSALSLRGMPSVVAVMELWTLAFHPLDAPLAGFLNLLDCSFLACMFAASVGM